MDRPDWAPAGIDLDKPSAAWVYDYSLGGCHNFAADREIAEALNAVVPDGPLIAQANRAFLRRAVRYLVDAGIRQFLDIGSGIPTVGNMHEVAQRAAPDARVVYVDIDPVAVAHSQAILAGNDQATAIQADARHPQAILAHRRVRELLDFHQPVAVLLVAVLHLIGGCAASIHRHLGQTRQLPSRRVRRLRHLRRTRTARPRTVPARLTVGPVQKFVNECRHNSRLDAGQGV